MKMKKDGYIDWAIMILTGLLVSGCTTIEPVKTSPPADPTPVLFVDGLDFGKTPTCFDTLEEIPELVELFLQHGYALKVACIPPNGKIENIAKILFYEQGRLITGNQSYHIVAKSMGGIVTREMLDDYRDNLEGRVLSVTTISTPHKGSVIADTLMGDKKADGSGCWRFHLLSQFGRLVYPEDEGVKESGKALTQKSMSEFNKKHPQNSQIPFYSFGYNIEPGDFWSRALDWLLPVYPVFNLISPSECFHNTIAAHGVTPEQKVNDGFVSEDSASWGTYLGTYEGEHFSETSSSFYKFHTIWPEIFEKVIVNLDREKHR